MNSSDAIPSVAAVKALPTKKPPLQAKPRGGNAFNEEGDVCTDAEESDELVDFLGESGTVASLGGWAAVEVETTAGEEMEEEDRSD